MNCKTRISNLKKKYLYISTTVHGNSVVVPVGTSVVGAAMETTTTPTATKTANTNIRALKDLRNVYTDVSTSSLK